MSKHPLNRAPGGPSRLVQHSLDEAILALRMQRADEAERIAAGVLKANRSNLLAAQVLGRALVMQNRADEAVIPLERAARRSDDPAIELELAGALAAAGRTDAALDRLQRTTARRPPFVPAFLEYSNQLARSGRHDEAMTVLERGLEAAPGAVDLRVTLAFAHIKRNDRVSARALLQRAVADAPQRPDILAALARVLAQDGEYSAAADLFRRALALQPDDAATRSSFGACLLEMGERDAGEASLRLAARGGPQMVGQTITALASASHGRFFLRPSDAVKFLHADKK
ncbi:MAG: tetratricopeptide repeat protein [Rhizobiales bacterium]|nr:tetratricopeptide repeat protein [Hyphomicrobiales bacterium]MBN8985509.1 tetratricopeptide repeat protein [Hyphomicrobiales bacterium]MBN9001183.1 tetratricopeptide repeat protein [Hyphomicrobiales bacterium]